MKKVLPFVLLFTIHFSLVWAQDTTKPFTMSMATYDSTLRAVKRADSVKKQVTLDSTRKVAMRADSARKSDSVIKANAIIKEDILQQNPPTEKNKDSATKNKEAIKAKVKDTTSKVHQFATKFAYLSYGLCLPVSDYSTVNAAKTGQNISIGAYFPGAKSRFGWAIKFDYGWNPLDSAQYLHNATDQIYAPGYHYTMNASNDYKYYNIMVGACVSFPIGKFSFDSRILFGSMTGIVPATSFNVKDGLGDSITVNKYEAIGHAFSFDFGFGLRYSIKPYFAVTLTFDYLIAKPIMALEASGYSVSSTTGEAIPITTYPYTAPQAFIMDNLNIGVCYVIEAKKK